MTKDAETHRALETEEAEQLLPLVIEVLPGQAGEGLVDIYQPGAFEGKSLRTLCESTLKKKDLKPFGKRSRAWFEMRSYQWRPMLL